MSHHGDERPPRESEVLRELLKATGQPIGPTGQFPQGKLTASDEGEIRIAIGTTPEGKVVMDFGKPTAWIGFDPAQALEIAETLRKHAESVRATALVGLATRLAFDASDDGEARTRGPQGWSRKGRCAKGAGEASRQGERR